MNKIAYIEGYLSKSASVSSKFKKLTEKLFQGANKTVDVVSKPYMAATVGMAKAVRKYSKAGSKRRRFLQDLAGYGPNIRSLL